MNRTSLLLAALLLVPAIVFAQPKKDRPDTDIEKAMHQIGKAYRQLRKQVADPAQNASSLELAATIRAGAVAAQKHVPLKAQDVAEADRAAFVDDFRRKMGEFIDTVDQLEGALQAGRNDEAVRLTKDLEELQKKDHKEFRRPEKHEMAPR
jgi:soluble cytochrome b562